jgi:hypothetical protein
MERFHLMILEYAMAKGYAYIKIVNNWLNAGG